MKKSFALLLFVLLVSIRAAIAFDFKNGLWVQNVTENSFTVLWTTAQNTFSWIEVTPDDGDMEYSSEPKAYYEVVSGRKMYGTFHCVTVSGLEKGKRYRYRIVGKEVINDSNPYKLIYGAEQKKTVHTIKTFDGSAPTCSFSMVNDMHFKSDKYHDLIGGMDKDKTDFIVLNGDIVSFVNSLDTLLKYSLNPINDPCCNYPVIYARGNHETRGSQWYMMHKAFPTPTGECYFSFRQGPVAFIVLDAGEDKQDSHSEYSGQAAFDDYRRQELEWLKKEVKKTEFQAAPHKVCIIHIPTFIGQDALYSQRWIAENFTPVLNAAGIDMMLSGHHHRYILADAGTDDNDFPIVVNGNSERLDFSADANSISIKTYDRYGNLIHILNY